MQIAAAVLLLLQLTWGTFAAGGGGTCTWSAWSAWGACSKTCGSGKQTRTRTKIGNGNGCSGSSSQQLDCNTGSCTVARACVVDNWGNWGRCSKVCGGGFRNKTRTIKVRPTGNNKCPNLTVTEACNTVPCITCNVTDWTAWTGCSKTCGGGSRTKRRTIRRYPTGDNRCPETSQIERCNTASCSGRQCVVSAWSAWGACSRTCGGGIQMQTRNITRAPTLGWTCPNLTNTRPCNTPICLVPCLVSEWTEWSACDATCGTGSQYRDRTITQQPTDGTSCPDLKELQTCNTDVCPENSDSPSPGVPLNAAWATMETTGEADLHPAAEAADRRRTSVEASPSQSATGPSNVLLIGGVCMAVIALAAGWRSYATSPSPSVPALPAEDVA